MRWLICICLLGAASVPLTSENPPASERSSSSTPDNARDVAIEDLRAIQEVLRNDPAFAGVWLTDDGLRVVASTQVDATASSLARISASADKVDVRQVPFSLARLNGIHSAIADSRARLSSDGLDVEYIETDVVSNLVLVGVVDADVKDLRRIEQEFGPGVEAASLPAKAMGHACTRSNCGNPLKGGLSLYQGTSAHHCNSGFVARRNANGRYGLLTGGHCSSLNDIYKHPAGTRIGVVVKQGWVDSSPADAALIDMDNPSRDSNLVLIDTDRFQAITSVQDPNRAVVGETVCFSGYGSGTKCGSLRGNNITMGVCKPGGGGCKAITSLFRADWLTVPGDSGGPVWYSGVAKGMVVSNSPYPDRPGGVFSHAYLIQQTLGVTIKVTP